MAGIGIYFLTDFFTKKRGKISQLWPVFALWLLSFSLVYFISLQQLSSSTYLINFWRLYFMPLPPWDNLSWFKDTWTGIMKDPLGFTGLRLGLLFTVLFIVGCVSACYKNWRIGFVLLAPIALTLFASGLQKYPFGLRMILFLVPLFYFLLAEGINFIFTWINKWSRWFSFAIIALLTLSFYYQPAPKAIDRFSHPNMGQHITPLLSYLNRNKQGTDTLYIYCGSIPAVKYYSSQYGLSSLELVYGIRSREEPKLYKQDVDQLKGRVRVWVIFTHIVPKNEKNIILGYLNKIGKQVEEITSPGAYLYLYDLSGG
jgi:hypothetical protein